MLNKEESKTMNSITEDTVTISKNLHNRLRRDARVLRALEAGGVGSWDWYEDSLSNCDMEVSDAEC